MTRESSGRIFLTFLKIGLTSFGGPLAHLEYFRREFVKRRQWLTESAYAELVALCQFLPGPASSQVGFAVGLSRGGLTGGLIAWLGFTLPSALLLFLFASGIGGLTSPAGQGFVRGLQVVALPVVAQAVWSMGRILSPDLSRMTIAAGAAIVTLSSHAVTGQIVAILVAAAAGLVFCRSGNHRSPPALAIAIPRLQAIAALTLFVVLLVALPLAAAHTSQPLFAVASAFYRAGALVFGGGHVVLPLLQASVVEPGWIGRDDFLTGYGAAQAVPGPLFSVAAYLGARMHLSPGALPLALLCVVSIFTPGLLLMAGVLPFWTILGSNRTIQASIRGVNAAVVGILLAALYNPVWVGAIHGPLDVVLALGAFATLRLWPEAPWRAVLLCAAGGAAVGPW